jgi:hypothetical protein
VAIVQARTPRTLPRRTLERSTQSTGVRTAFTKPECIRELHGSTGLARGNLIGAGRRLSLALYAGGQKSFPSRETLKHGAEGHTPTGHYVALFDRKPRSREKAGGGKKEKEDSRKKEPAKVR